MIKLRIIYSKSKEAIYLSHLNMLDVFESSFKRANIPMQYSDGFTKRPELVFASPLTVGIESTGEILEIELLEIMDIPFFIREVNKVLPPAITILSAEYVKENEKNIMSRVFASIYTIEIACDNESLKNKTLKEIEDIKKYYKNKMQSYLEQDKILVNKEVKFNNKDKKNKSNDEEQVNIKPKIKNYEFLFNGKLEVTVDTGSNSNLKPDLFMQGFCEFINEEIEYTVKREKIMYK